jgi:hypothetical protein
MNATKMGSDRTRRRAIALGLMLALGASAVDAVAGPVRDGSVHYASARQDADLGAVSFADHLGPTHDHDGPLEPTATQQACTVSQPGSAAPSGETEREHADGDDHCGHVHGVALIPAVSLTVSAIAGDAPTTFCAHHDDPFAASFRRPPKV